MNGSRPWMIALAASATVNVFLIGGLAGMAYVRLTTPAPVPVVAPAQPRAVEVAPVAPAVVQPAPEKPATRPERPSAARPAPPPPVVEAPSPAEASAPSASAAPPRPPLISAADSLSPESRQAFRRALTEANRLNRPLTRQARAERQAALAALTAPGYDATEVGRRLAAARALDQQARANVEAALAAFTASLSPQERAALAEGLRRVYAPAAARRAAALGGAN